MVLIKIESVVVTGPNWFLPAKDTLYGPTNGPTYGRITLGNVEFDDSKRSVRLFVDSVAGQAPL